VHTNDAAGAITRFIDMGIEPFLVASVMLVSFAQRLVRRVCPNCSEPFHPTAEALSFWDAKPPGEARFLRGRGCFHCQDTGYRGRIGVYEILLIDDVIRDMIVKNRASHEITRYAHEAGHLRLLKDDAFEKVVRGITTMEEAASAVMV
jgi:type IV pilus assembly protein PilB